MKEYFITLLLLFNALLVLSQKEVATGINFCHAGKNFYVKHNFFTSPLAEWQIGLKYHINRYPIHNENNYFYKAVEATSLRERIGFNASYFRSINPKTEYIPFRLFYDFQYTNSKTLGIYLYPYQDALKPNLYVRTKELRSTATMIEQAIGLNTKLLLNKKIFLNISLGGSLTYIWNFESLLAEKLGYTSKFEPSLFTSVNLTYRYKEKKGKQKKKKEERESK